MKLSKAREKLGILADSFDEDCDKEWTLAINIGSGAIERLKWQREHPEGINTNPLPGETPEETEASHET